MNGDLILVARMRYTFEDTPEIADWFKQDPDDEYNYRFAETYTHLLGMWDTMQAAADHIEDLVVEIERLRKKLGETK